MKALALIFALALPSWAGALTYWSSDFSEFSDGDVLTTKGWTSSRQTTDDYVLSATAGTAYTSTIALSLRNGAANQWIAVGVTHTPLSGVTGNVYMDARVGRTSSGDLVTGLGNHTGGFVASGYAIYLQPAASTVYIQRLAAGGGSTNLTSTTGISFSGLDATIRLIWNPTTDALSAYVNGTLCCTATDSTFNPTNFSSAGEQANHVRNIDDIVLWDGVPGSSEQRRNGPFLNRRLWINPIESLLDLIAKPAWASAANERGYDATGRLVNPEALYQYNIAQSKRVYAEEQAEMARTTRTPQPTPAPATATPTRTPTQVP